MANARERLPPWAVLRPPRRSADSLGVGEGPEDEGRGLGLRFTVEVSAAEFRVKELDMFLGLS